MSALILSAENRLNQAAMIGAAICVVIFIVTMAIHHGFSSKRWAAPRET